MSSPPHYVLLSHSTLSASPSHVTVNTTPTLTHPTIQYRFRDDPPLSFPNTHHAHVLVMDYDPASPELAQVQSLSPQLSVISLKVTDAPGAGSMPEADEPKNNKMYVLETVAHPPVEKEINDVHPVASLATFKQRNLLLRKALEYPLPSGPSPLPASAPSSTHAVSPTPSPSRRPAPLPPQESST